MVDDELVDKPEIDDFSQEYSWFVIDLVEQNSPKKQVSNDTSSADPEKNTHSAVPFDAIGIEWCWIESDDCTSDPISDNE